MRTTTAALSALLLLLTSTTHALAAASNSQELLLPALQPALCPRTATACSVLSNSALVAFDGESVPFTSAGTIYALRAPEMQVALHVTENNVGSSKKLLVDSLTYYCGQESQNISTASLATTGPVVLQCNSGSCAKDKSGCQLSVSLAAHPAPHVRVDSIIYAGSRATGGLCYGRDELCAEVCHP
ncbi:hypothetical protein BJ741DRAFT_574222 [Chytriomyces cf. hyalinus JEL632]|nr:hypothetical protein BJ741DRAFT_574222 [Chytriomyces cf. hyalinus JEL632]